MVEILKREYELSSSVLDNHKRLRLSALLSHMQNMATDHAEILRFDAERMTREHRAVWIMTRSLLRLKRPIRMGEVLHIHTWPRPISRSISVFRDFDLFVDGEHVGEATMSWVLADIENRRMLKPSTIPALIESPHPAVVKDVIPGKIQMPETLTPRMRRPVYYSDTDVIGHMNNTKYADIACDAIHYENCGAQFIAEMQINYLQESFPGDELAILHGAEGDAHYIRGIDGDGKSRFEVRLKLEDC